MRCWSRAMRALCGDDPTRIHEHLMDLQPGHYITLALAGVGFVVWLVRLEGRVNALKENGAKHDTTRDEVIRLQEQVRYLTQAVQDLAAALKPATRRRISE